MMSVNKVQIPLRDINMSGTSINIPLFLSFMPVDNTELIETKFIDDEVDKVINPIIDYKKVRFLLADNITDWNIVPKIKINLNFFIATPTGNPSPPFTYAYDNPTTYDGAGTYGDLFFQYDDIFCRTDRLMNSFLRLTFFDSPDTSTNTLLFFTDIFTQIEKDQMNEWNFVLPPDNCTISFILGDSVLEPDTIHEGFYLYWFKDLVDNSPNGEYEMYMSVVYSNAGNGETIPMYPLKTDLSVPVIMTDLNGPTGGLFLKVILKNDNGIYKYIFDPLNIVGGVSQIPPIGGVDMNPAPPTLPGITLWQIQPNEGD